MEYYNYAKERGIDYNYYGDWQKNCAKMLVWISGQSKLLVNNSKSSILLDVGTACGLMVRAFKELKVFNQCIGIDKSEYMIELGRKTHDLSANELIVCDIVKDNLPVEDKSVFLLNCSHILEHIEEEHMPKIFEEFKRVLHPKGKGIIIVPAAKPGITIEEIKSGDNTHITVRSSLWWKNQIKNYFKIDNSINNRFRTCKYSPTNNKQTFHDHYQLGWTIIGFLHK